MNPTLALFRILHHPGSPLAPSTIILHNTGTSVSTKCSECGKFVVENPGYAGAECVANPTGLPLWPDLVNHFELVVSARMVTDLSDYGASGYIAHPVRLSLQKGCVSKDLPAGNYFIIEVSSYVDIDRQFFDGGDGLLCGKCRTWKPRPNGNVSYGDKMTVPLLDSWDGSDFVVFHNIRYGGFYCSMRIVELARVKKWSGIGFGSVLPNLPPVNLSNPDWLSEIAAATKLRYPFFF